MKRSCLIIATQVGKRTFLFLVFFLSCCLLRGQEIILQSALVAPAGNRAETGTLNVSRWRLAMVHQLVIPESQTTGSPGSDLLILPNPAWKVQAFPNPFNRTLSLYFQSPGDQAFIVRVTDMSGKQWSLLELTIAFTGITSLDLSPLPSGIYLIGIVSKDGKQQQVIKVQKN